MITTKGAQNSRRRISQSWWNSLSAARYRKIWAAMQLISYRYFGGGFVGELELKQLSPLKKITIIVAWIDQLKELDYADSEIAFYSNSTDGRRIVSYVTERTSVKAFKLDVKLGAKTVEQYREHWYRSTDETEFYDYGDFDSIEQLLGEK